MKINVLKRLIPLAVIFLCVNSTWAQDDAATNAYLVALTAQAAPESTGEGNVKLTLVDITGKTISGGPWAYLGNEKNPSDYARSVTMLGGTISATGLELEMGDEESQIYMTYYAYYKAEVQSDAGSYFAGWNVSSSYVAKKTEENGCVTFKVLPDAKGDNVVVIPNGDMSKITQEALTKGLTAAKANARNVYAVFNKYLLSNPSATNIKMENTAGSTAEITISMDIEGDIDALDMEKDFKSLENTDNAECWTIPDIKVKDNWELTYGSQTNKVRGSFKVIFKVQENMAPGIYKSTLTVSMAGKDPSVLNIPVEVTVLDANPPEAVLYDGKTQKKSGDLSDILGEISNYEDPIIQLQKDCDGLSLENKSFTLDLNGNEVNGITLSGGTLTLAYSKFGGKAWAVTVNGGKLILNGGTLSTLTISNGAVVEQNGATVNQQIDNKGTFTITEGLMQNGIISSGTLTMQGGIFKSTVIITDGTAHIKRGTISGTSNGVLAKGGTTTIEKLAAISGKVAVKADGGTVKINCGKFDGPLEGNIDFTAGYFKDNKNYGVPTEGKTELKLTTGVEYNEGYLYFLGTSDAAKNNGVGVCRIGETGYATLEDALAYANNNKDKEVIIFMTNDYTLPAGYYTLPPKATIVVPMSDSQENMVNEVAPKIVFNTGADESAHYTNNSPKEYRRLTFAKGVNMDVFGAIEMTCTQYSSNEAYTGQPVGPYGHLVMEEGSHMTLQSGSQLRAWGFMTGLGETDARRGATVHEFFQMGDWKGAFTSVKIVGMIKEGSPLYNAIGNDGDKKIFPVSQYFIQNIESPVKYHPGAVLTTAAAVSEFFAGMNVAMAANDIKIIGVTDVDAAIFLMDNKADADNTWVKKSYLVQQDIQNYDVNSAAHIGSMVIDLGTLSFGGMTVPIQLNSAKFDLPITSNMKIHLRSGTMDFLQNTSLIPGSEVEVDKESTVLITMQEDDKKAKADGKTYYSGALYVYDAANWEKYAYQNEKGTTGYCYTKIVRYAPSWNDGVHNGRPNLRKEDEKPNSAKINVHGTFKTNDGYVYTSEAGANIFSSNEDAGTFIFNNGTEDAGSPTVSNVKTIKLSGVSADVEYEDLTFYPADLRNGDDDSKTKTYYGDGSGYNAQAGDAYCYSDSKWSIWKVAEDDECFMTDGTDYYAKPQEYVKVVVVKDKDGNLMFDEKSGHFRGNDDHTYSDAAGTGRLFILMTDDLTGDCQWWEVEKKDNLYHCIHPDNDTYYEWNDIDKKWQEKCYFITWKNWDGTIIKTKTVESGDEVETESYSVPYGTMAEFLGTNPTRDADIDYTYDFTGWTPALGKVTSDVTYTATYKRKPRKYTISFCNEGGSVIERQFLTHNEVPVCENVPTKIGHYLQWNPAIAAVTGDATYTATWLEEKPTTYEVRFVDYDGKEIRSAENIEVGKEPTAPTIVNGVPVGKEGIEYGKSATNEFTYIFDHWSPAIKPVDGAITYTAVYKEVAKTYTIEFRNDDEESSLIETNQYAYGAIPVCSKTPVKASTAKYTYTLVWEPQIEAVRDNAIYKATFPATLNKYTVTLRSNNDAVCTFTGAGIYDHGTKVTIAANVAGDYEFVRWEERAGGATLDEIIKGDITLTAVVKTKDKKIENLEIATNAIVDVAGLAEKEVMDLIITSNGTQSGQLLNADQLTVDGSAHFDLSLGFAANTWYAFGLPWRVNTNGGIFVNGNALSIDKNCLILEYNGAQRAAGKADPVMGCWNNVPAGATLEPGHLYMIYLATEAQTVRFTKAPNTTLAPVVNTTINVTAYGSSSDTKNAGWNGIANPSTYYATLTSVGVMKGQKYIPGALDADGKPTDKYETFTLATEKLAVGQPLFVQVEENKTWVADEGNKFLAPRRATASEETLEYELRIAPADGDYTDRLYISAMDEKDDTYVIGQDLAKISVSRGVAQLWVERYDAKLSVNATELDSDNKAAFPLGIYAPKAGNYELSTVTAVPNDEELILTYDGMPVKDLSMGTYMATLQAGTNRHYGLLLVHKAPQITTDGGMVETDASNIRKVFIDGQVYIIRDGNIYSIFGQQIQ